MVNISFLCNSLELIIINSEISELFELFETLPAFITVEENLFSLFEDPADSSWHAPKLEGTNSLSCRCGRVFSKKIYVSSQVLFKLPSLWGDCILEGSLHTPHHDEFFKSIKDYLPAFRAANVLKGLDQWESCGFPQLLNIARSLLRLGVFRPANHLAGSAEVLHDRALRLTADSYRAKILSSALIVKRLFDEFEDEMVAFLTGVESSELKNADLSGRSWSFITYADVSFFRSDAKDAVINSPAGLSDTELVDLTLQKILLPQLLGHYARSESVPRLYPVRSELLPLLSPELAFKNLMTLPENVTRQELALFLSFVDLNLETNEAFSTRALNMNDAIGRMGNFAELALKPAWVSYQSLN